MVEESGARKADLAGKLVLAAASTLLALLGAEVTFRFWAVHEDRARFEEVLREPPPVPASGNVGLIHIIRPSSNSRIVYELRPNLAVTFRGQPMTTSDVGFRDRGYSDVKAPGTVRVLGLGDSYMFGWGVGDGEDYLSRLELQLNAASPETTWEVINTAVPGYNTAMQVETLEKKGLRYGPDLVILGLISNDLDLPNFIRVRRDPWSLSKSFLADFTAGRLHRLAAKNGLAPSPRDPNHPRRLLSDPSRVPQEYRDLVGWEAFTNSLRRLAALGNRHGFRIVVFLIGNNPWQRDATELSKSIGIEVVDANLRFQQYLRAGGHESRLGSPLSVSDTDGHLSSIGHEIAAELLFEALRDRGLL